MESEIFLFFVTEFFKLSVPQLSFWMCSLLPRRFALVDGDESPTFEIRPNAAMVPFLIIVEALPFIPAEIFLFFEAGGMAAAASWCPNGSVEGASMRVVLAPKHVRESKRQIRGGWGTRRDTLT